jgi:nucleoid-associated protein Lsr2
VAQKVNIVLVDDLDGSEANETVAFGLDGSAYEIDLSDKNAKKLRDALSLYTASARRSGRRQARSAVARSNVDTAAIRAWAKSKGYEVSDRGRISADILEAYKKADKRK